MLYCSIDVETTGLDPENCDLIEIGAVVDDLKKQEEIDLLPSFHCYIVKPFYRGDPYALSMHPVIFERIGIRKPGFNYYTPEDAMQMLAEFLKTYFGDSKIIVAGKNFLGLDKPFLSKLPGFSQLKLHHRPLDPGMLYWNWQEDKEVPSSAECMKRAGLKGSVAHTAVEDAKMVIRLLRNKAQHDYKE